MKKFCLILIPLCLVCNYLPSQSWVVDYLGSYPSGSTHFSTGFVDMDGVTFLAGREGPSREQPETLLLRIDPDGSHSSFIYHKTGYHSKASCIVETIENHLFVAGTIFNDEDDALLVLVFDKNLNLLEERCYEKEVDALSFGDCKAAPDSHGNIIVSTTVRQPTAYGNFNERGAFFKFNCRGDIISHRYLIADAPDPVYYLMDFWLKQMWYQEKDETLLCLANGYGNVTSFITFDSAFNYIEEHPIWRVHNGKDDHTLYNDCFTDHWLSDQEALFFGGKGDDEHNRLRVSRVNTQGEFLQHTHLNERPDSIDSPAKHRCMATANDSTLYFGFYQHTIPYYPGIASIYLLNEHLDIIGLYVDETHNCCRTNMILPTRDGGCLIVNDSCNMGAVLTFGHPIVTKLNREDFKTVSWSVIQSAPEPQHIFPNPTEGMLTIPLPHPRNLHTYCRISDQHGRTVVDREIQGFGNGLQMDVSQLKSGLYIIQIYTHGKNLFTEQFFRK